MPRCAVCAAAVAVLLAAAPLQARSRKPAKPEAPAEPIAAPSNSPAIDPAELAKMQGLSFPYDLLDRALQGRIGENGDVDYAALKGNRDLNTFVSALPGADLTRFPVFHRTTKEGKPADDHSAELVFWINAFNGMMLKTVGDAYPVSSPLEIKNLYTARTHVVAGKAYSFEDLLSAIGHMDERALFCLTDGSHAGPLLAARAYRFSNINERLNAAAGVFVNDPRNVSIDRTHNVVGVNPYLAQVDTMFSPPNARRKWDGIRYLLSAYSKQRSSKDYFAGGEYQIAFLQTDSSLNNKELR